MQTIVNAKDKQCPAPLILTKQAITHNSAGCEIIIECNNATSKDNIITYLNELKINAKTTQNGEVFSITFTNPEKADPTIKAENYCNTKKVRTIVIKSEQMGDGDTTLGTMLMRAFINALPEADHLPDNIILYNSGVKTAVKNSDTVDTYNKLESQNVNIIVCGTCIDYYRIKENLGAGKICNIYKITEILNASDTIIYP